MENDEKQKYKTEYGKQHYITYAVQILKDSAQDIEQYRMLNNMSKSDFLKECISYFLENH